MTTVTSPELMTTEALLQLPEDGTERWLIKGKLRQKQKTVELRQNQRAVRDRFHSSVMAATTTYLKNWRDHQPEPRGEVLCGEAGLRLSRDPDTTFGVDVAYVSPEVMARQNDETALINGVPVLTVEILTP